MESQIDLKNILMLSNVLDSERTQMVEKYSLMINSENDLSTYIKIRNELKDMISYYSNSDMEQRKINMDKKMILDSVAINTSELENKILNMFSLSNTTDQNQTKHYLYMQGLIYQKYKKLSNMSPADSEYYKLKEWLDCAVNIPFNINLVKTKKDNLGQMLAKIKQGLDAELFGMEKVKEELLMAINQRFINPTKADTSIALVGPPGVGKTKIITVLAKIMSYPWEHISMGGTNDSSFLAGHSYTYEGARPGQLVNALIRMKCKDGIIFFDEIDKIADTSNGKEVSNQLLHITDFTQNDHFCDKYMPEIPIDLSKIWFIFSLNSIAAIDPVLSNRFNFIYVDGYDTEEKLTICKDHLLPKAFDKYKLSADKYEFTDQILRKIITHSIQRENSANAITETKTGIRELKRSIDHIFNRLSLLENMINNKHSSSNIVESLSFYPKHMEIKNMLKLKLTPELIDNFLS
jgi:ATP-dependent Lon protease